jgi:hypothetical protein
MFGNRNGLGWFGTWVLSLFLVLAGIALLAQDRLSGAQTNPTVLGPYGDCGGVVRPESPNGEDWQCCNGTWYDARGQGCCGGAVYDLNTEACCEDQVYDPASECCCVGEVIPQ